MNERVHFTEYPILPHHKLTPSYFVRRCSVHAYVFMRRTHEL